MSSKIKNFTTVYDEIRDNIHQGNEDLDDDIDIGESNLVSVKYHGLSIGIGQGSEQCY